MRYQRIKGTFDILPDESAKWVYLEEIVRDAMRRFNYKEIRPPVFEMTELFARGIGEGTDIVSKEMFSFTDMGGRNLTLTPGSYRFGGAGIYRGITWQEVTPQ